MTWRGILVESVSKLRLRKMSVLKYLAKKYHLRHENKVNENKALSYNH